MNGVPLVLRSGHLAILIHDRETLRLAIENQPGSRDFVLRRVTWRAMHPEKTAAEITSERGLDLFYADWFGFFHQSIELQGDPGGKWEIGTEKPARRLYWSGLPMPNWGPSRLFEIDGHPQVAFLANSGQPFVSRLGEDVQTEQLSANGESFRAQEIFPFPGREAAEIDLLYQGFWLGHMVWDGRRLKERATELDAIEDANGNILFCYTTRFREALKCGYLARD